MKNLLITVILITCLASLPPAHALTQQFLSLADIHFDPFISCDNVPCPLIKKLQQAPANQWSSILSQADTSTPQYGQDSDYFLLESSLEAVNKVAQKTNPQFTLVIGDLLAHHFDSKYRKYSGDKTKKGYISFVKKTLLFLTAELKRTLPKTDIYMAIGNNDSYQKDYSAEPNGLFFKDFSTISAILAKDERNKTQMLHGGYYALDTLKQSRLRLIVLNSVLFSTKARGPHIDQAAQEELNWLHHELIAANRKQQHVLIIMHIPNGIDKYASFFHPLHMVQFWKPQYSQRFVSEIQQSTSPIMGILTAHIHRAVPFTGTPSISPIYGNDPGFKVYSYSFPSLKLNGFSAYAYSLQNGEWQHR